MPRKTHARHPREFLSTLADRGGLLEPQLPAKCESVPFRVQANVRDLLVEDQPVTTITDQQTKIADHEDFDAGHEVHLRGVQLFDGDAREPGELDVGANRSLGIE